MAAFSCLHGDGRKTWAISLLLINTSLYCDTLVATYISYTRALTWREHINVLSHKANTTLAFLRRNIKPCSSHIKAMSYLSYVNPIIEYSSTVWDPHIKEDVHKLEMVQRRAARFVYNHYNSTDIVSQACYNLYTGLL